ncbi:hypothetical protein [Altererythrobacter aquiaggeris]|uniref:hypothetical protein n=1 Tax=Aestuarierythrobacter aquiaggeris TaxID=1898396 RepID=UPI003017E8C0
MTMTGTSAKRSGIAARLLLAGSLLGLALPSAGLALGDNGAVVSFAKTGMASFTPAGVDAELARRVASRFDGAGKMRFTPAGSPSKRVQSSTVAVRVDSETARAISVRSAVKIASTEVGSGQPISKIRIAPTRYNLGASRGYESFAKPFTIGSQIADVQMPDLASFKPGKGTAPKKPGRFDANIELERERTVGRSPSTLQGIGDQAVDVSGSFRVAKNLNLTAGVRLSQDLDRIAPLTDATQDAQAVYVGTRFKF